ncbi:hypothetical protein [Feifania hominis]|uniref:hypothetical protein n=1 Tax=Feifania hominis TaxID=2763660 RepID=UPI0020163171|nr:hypothetical protein [Feifania hominis]
MIQRFTPIIIETDVLCPHYAKGGKKYVSFCATQKTPILKIPLDRIFICGKIEFVEKMGA